MSIPQTLQSFSENSSAIIFSPGELDSDEPQLENYLHLKQIILLITCLEWLWRERQDFFAAGNLTIYYSPEQKKSEDFRGPDFFVVLDTERRSRKSWVVWNEGEKYPNVIIEILSESTAKVDRGEKKQIYQDIFGLPDYFWFDPETLEFEGFTLVSSKYQAIESTKQGWKWSEQLGLYLGVYEQKLRFYTPEGRLVPTPDEAAIQAEAKAVSEAQQKEIVQQQLDTERQQKESAQQQLEQLKAQLRALGVEPEQ